MRTYSSAWATSLFAGWLAAIIVYVASYYLLFGFPKADAFYLWVMVIVSPMFSLIGSAIFVFPLKSLADKLIYKIPQVAFAFLLSTYGLIIFIPALHWLSGLDLSYPKHRLVFVNAALNGLVYGLVFYFLRKPAVQANQKWTTSTTPS
jgi:hypothetical protein